MPKNRLDLDFKLETNEERAQFVNEYLAQPQFIQNPPTEAESETIANYILWGKDPKTGLNSKQSKEIQLESRYKTWDFQQDESYEALLESPNFNEAIIKGPSEPILKKKREVFSREEARAEAPPHILAQLEPLWQQIDELELELNYYDLIHGRRESEPREELLNRIPDDKKVLLHAKAANLKQYQYLKLRHYLVELRRDQFAYRDSYRSLILPLDSHAPAPPVSRDGLDCDVPVFPIGLKYSHPITRKLFPRDRFPNPDDFTAEDVKYIIELYWKLQDVKKSLGPNEFWFSFTELEHVYNFLMLLDTFQDQSAENLLLANCAEFIHTLKFYTNRAELTEVQLLILDLKLKRIKNSDIARYVNGLYKKNYSTNYISTIFRQKIIPQINDAAAQHELIIQNLCFPENFKKCRTCHTSYLIDPSNFTRKSRSKDGYSNQCKKCDKKSREEKKLNETKEQH